MSWGSGNFKHRGCSFCLCFGWLLSSFWLCFPFLGLLLFLAWGGFFLAWGGFLGGWGVLCVSFFFVALFRGRFVLFGSCPVPLGVVRGSCVRVVSRLRLVRVGGFVCPRVAWALSVGACGGCVPALCLLALRAARVFVVGRLVCGRCLRCLFGRLGRLGWCSRGWRSALSVFLVFFNICRACLWHPPRAFGFFGRLGWRKIKFETV